MKKRKGSGELGVLLIIVAVLVIIGLLFKSCAPQSRFMSRLGGKFVEISLPADCADYESIISVSLDGGRKNVTYHSTGGVIKSREYTDYGIFEGGIVWKLSDEASENN